MTTAAKPQTAPLPLPPPATTRMKLSAVVKGKVLAPYRILLYGVEGIGKSTFGASAPNPIFLGAEDGTKHLDVHRFPTPAGGLTFADLFEAFRELESGHDYKTLVLDTLDWLEPIVWQYVIKDANSRSKERVHGIEDVGGGFGKGYTAAVEQWRKVVAALERMQAASKMHVVLLAHSHVKGFKNPTGDDYDRYQLKMNEKAAGVWKEWSDYLLFAKYEDYAKKDERTKRVRGVSTGARIIHTAHSAAWDAKFRGEAGTVPDEFPLSWADFEEIARAAAPDAAGLRAEIEAKAKELGGELAQKVLETLKKAGTNTQSLVVILNRVNAKLAEQSAEKEQPES